MLPIRDHNPTHSFPVLTVALIVINVGVFLQQLSQGLDISVLRFGLIPAELVHGVDQAYRVRIGFTQGTLQNYDPAWQTLFTSMFMHGSWLHILSNMWSLWVFGNNVEDRLGKPRFLLFYLLAGVGAAAAQVLVGTTSQTPMVGASGAIAGVMAAYMVLFPHSRIDVLIFLGIFVTTATVPAAVVVGIWFILQLLHGLVQLGPRASMGGVAYAAHVGGFVAGLLLVHLVAAGIRPPKRAHEGWRDWDDR